MVTRSFNRCHRFLVFGTAGREAEPSAMKKKPTTQAIRMAREFAKLFDALQQEWTAVVVILRKR